MGFRVSYLVSGITAAPPLRSREVPAHETFGPKLAFDLEGRAGMAQDARFAELLISMSSVSGERGTSHVLVNKLPTKLL